MLPYTQGCLLHSGELYLDKHPWRVSQHSSSSHKSHSHRPKRSPYILTSNLSCPLTTWLSFPMLSSPSSPFSGCAFCFLKISKQFGKIKARPTSIGRPFQKIASSLQSMLKVGPPHIHGHEDQHNTVANVCSHTNLQLKITQNDGGIFVFAVLEKFKKLKVFVGSSLVLSAWH